LLRGNGGWWCAGIHDRLDSVWTDKSHQEKCLADGIRELRCLLKELRGSLRFVGGEGLHLAEDFEELLRREGVDGSGDGVGACHTGRELFARREWWNRS
jgi:hypothetical protein